MLVSLYQAGVRMALTAPFLTGIRRVVLVLAGIFTYVLAGSQCVHGTHLPCSLISKAGGGVPWAAMTGRPSTQVCSRRQSGDYGGFNRPRHRVAAITHDDGSLNLSTWTNRLLALNVVMFGLQQIYPQVTRFGIKADVLINNGQYHRLFTPMLLHANFAHLFTNSYSMLNVGDAVEGNFGAKSFLALYVISGFCGNALSYASGTAPLALGASTSVAGLMGALGFFAFRHRSLGGNLRSAFQSVAQVVLLNAFMGASNPRIDNMGHLGGFLGGVACAYLFGPRILPITDNYGRTYMTNIPVLRELWARGVLGLQKVGVLPKSKRPRPPPPPRKPSLLQRLKSALRLPDSNASHRRPGRGSWGTAMINTPSFSGGRSVGHWRPVAGKGYHVYSGIRLHGGVMMPKPLLFG